eukprot:gb/GFBE01072526.1/.p1 GENE.gb/GFBE01072526.1/~~gb/GFBE01072526.1/.p1  ORF type:complete len:516 (+),score=123.90 gb/GFBE01072526.1/:1-1548(+)
MSLAEYLWRRHAIVSAVVLCSLSNAFAYKHHLRNSLGAGRAASNRSIVAAEVAWKRCAQEGEAVDLPGLVRFGFGENWVEAELPPGASCSSANFNGQDPRPYTRKVCECAGSTLDTSHFRKELGVFWEHCAMEGQDCSCNTGNVRFGEGNRWAAVEKGFQATPVPCTATSFGEDPSYNRVKECWCARASNHAVKAAKVAIVMLSRHPPDLNAWLRYHLGHAGVEHVFIKAEDSPDVATTLQQLPQDFQAKVTLWDESHSAASVIGLIAEDKDNRPQDDYSTLQDRQMTAMARAKEECVRMGIDWLIHIDDDELLYTPQQRKIGDLLAAMPSQFNQAYLPNVEAVYESAKVKSCFMETKQVNLNRYTFESYANGKSALRVISNQKVHPAGPHQWRDSLNQELNSVHMDKEPFGTPLMVVHYESCPFSRWQDKFWELGNTSPDKISAIPFPFYRESISRMQSCRSSSASLAQGMSVLGCSQAELANLWSRWKTVANPKLESKDLMPINIPWDTIIGG